MLFFALGARDIRVLYNPINWSNFNNEYFDIVPGNIKMFLFLFLLWKL